MPPVNILDLYEMMTSNCKWLTPHWRQMSNILDDDTYHVTNTRSPIRLAWLRLWFQPDKNLGAWYEMQQRQGYWIFEGRLWYCYQHHFSMRPICQVRSYLLDQDLGNHVSTILQTGNLNSYKSDIPLFLAETMLVIYWYIQGWSSHLDSGRNWTHGSFMP